MTSTKRKFHIQVLGKTLEHLGVQMYKRRDVAIAELVANCWDADANNVFITIPEPNEYDRGLSKITITDDGIGMNADQVQDQYLVVGRNRRSDTGDSLNGRLVMGRKGIGKLAGFGLASEMTVITWKDDYSTRFDLSAIILKKDPGVTEQVPIEGIIDRIPEESISPSGTTIELRNLKHVSPIDINKLRESLARRFSRSVRGHMNIYVNNDQLNEPDLNLEYRNPDETQNEYIEETLSDGNKVKYYYGFTTNPIHSNQMRGFTILVRGKTAQAPPFFFFVEDTASGQHSTKYLTGVIEADFLDEGTEDETDKISTDRQEVDWEDENLLVFKNWGDELTRRALRERASRNYDMIVDEVKKDSSLLSRVERLESVAQEKVWDFLKQIGESDAKPEEAKPLADTLVRAYEYRHFHDVIQQLEDVSDDPDKLHLLVTHLHEWKVVESRAILEIVKGRLDIIEKFHELIINNAAETAHHIGADNLHDLIAGYPWLINPEWQILAEEKRISTQLKEWNIDEIKDIDSRLRYDFIALTGDNQLVVIDIKRSKYSVTFEELQKLDLYKDRLNKAHQNISVVMICSGYLEISSDTRRIWETRPDGEILTWSEIYDRTNKYYDHYRAVLEGEVGNVDFVKKELEVAKTRDVINKNNVYRGKDARAEGLGPQDADYTDGDPKNFIPSLQLELPISEDES